MHRERAVHRPDCQEPPGAAPREPRVPLSRERIVLGAISLIDDAGTPRFTMRLLASALGVESMSLYHYVSSKEQLLDEVVEHLVQEIWGDRDVVSAPPTGWQELLRHWALGIRRVALRHPLTFPLLAARPREVPWLSPPLGSPPMAEIVLSRMVADHFSDTEAVAAYRAFSSFLLGHLLVELAAQQTGGAPGRERSTGATGDAGPGDGPAPHPTVMRLESTFRGDPPPSAFEDSLEDLLAQIATTRSAR